MTFDLSLLFSPAFVIVRKLNTATPVAPTEGERKRGREGEREREREREKRLESALFLLLLLLLPLLRFVPLAMPVAKAYRREAADGATRES